MELAASLIFSAGLVLIALALWAVTKAIQQIAQTMKVICLEQELLRELIERKLGQSFPPNEKPH